jgi:hypothetical protein
MLRSGAGGSTSEALTQGPGAAVDDLALGRRPLGVDVADLTVETRLLHDTEDVRGLASYVSVQGVVRVGVVHAGGRDVVELLARAGFRLGDVDDVETSGPPKRVICTARIARP